MVLQELLLVLLYGFSFLGMVCAIQSPYSFSALAKENCLIIVKSANGIRITAGVFEFYFNATNGGEITEYFDVTVDPGRSRNLVNLGWSPYYNLCPLFASMFYNPYTGSFLTTGGDGNASVALISNTSDYAILQTASRIMSRTGQIARDSKGNAIYVNSSWIIRDNGLISVERTFIVPTRTTVPSGWRWYPFYLTRKAAFGYNATFSMFNTTYSYSTIVNQAIYKNVFSLFSLLPNDTSSVCGVGFSFSNVTEGGDGTHNILVSYKYQEMVEVNEWRTDNYYSRGNNILEGGPVHEFTNTSGLSTHTYHMLVNFTHGSVDGQSLRTFAVYHANNASMAALMNCVLSANQDSYKLGDQYAFRASGASYYDFTGLTARLTVVDNTNRIVYQKSYGSANARAGQPFNVTLLTGTIGSGSVPGYYTLSLQIFSSVGIVIASSLKPITVS
jgi:hypothetical protein